MTYLWQEVYGEPFYRIQTDEKCVAEKIRRRKGFNSNSIIVLNRMLWIFPCRFSRPDIARKTLMSITGVKGKIDSDGLFVFQKETELSRNKQMVPTQNNSAVQSLGDSWKK
jgi:hypothetical protein